MSFQWACSSPYKLQCTNWLNEGSIINGIFSTMALNFGKLRDSIHLVTDSLNTTGTCSLCFYCRKDLSWVIVPYEKNIRSTILQCQCEMEVYCFNFLCCSASSLTMRSWIVSLPNVLCLMYQCRSVLCFLFWVVLSCWLRKINGLRHVRRSLDTREDFFFFSFSLVQLICWYWWWPGGRMYDVIYFNVWSDIICTAAKLLHGTSAFSLKSTFFLMFCLLQAFIRQVRRIFWPNENSFSLHKETEVGGLHLNCDKACEDNLPGKVLRFLK